MGIGEKTVSLEPNQKLLDIALQSFLPEAKFELNSIWGFSSKEKIYLRV